jgi:hypothetical protein
MGRVPARLHAVLIALTVLAHATPASAQTPSPPEGWVVLPVDEYRGLRERTVPPPPPALTPLDATLTRVDYDLRMDGETVAGRALLTIDMLRDGWTRVPIPAGLMVRDATLNGQPVSLFEGPPAHVLLTRAGRFVLSLDIALPVASTPGTDSIALPASPSAISRATLALARGGVDLSVTGGFIAERGEDPRQSRWVVYGQPNRPLGLAWKRKVDDRRAEPLRVRARVIQVVGLGEDTSQVATSVKVEVVQGVAREVTLALPAGLVVNQVNGATVADWEATGERLNVRLLEPVSTEAAFVVLGESRLPRDGAIVVPLVRVPSAERESGGVAVDVVGAGEVAGRLTRGLDPADPSELGDIASGRESPSMIAFRLRNMAGADPRGLTVDVVRYTPQAVLIANVEEARYRALAAEDGRLLVEARYAVRNNQRSFLKVTMPTGSSVWTATVAGRPTRPGVAEAGAVLLPLEKGRAGEEAPTFVVTLVYLQPVEAWPDKGSLRLTLPALDLPVSRTGLRLHHSPRFSITPEAGAFRVEDDSGPFSEALRASRPSAAARPAAPSGSAMLLAVPSPAAGSGLQTLIDRYKSESGIRVVTGSLPVDVAFPDLGPSIFLASELTADGRAPVLDVKVKRTKR